MLYSVAAQLWLEDPSGKTDMRKNAVEGEQINSNIERFKYQMSRFIDISDGKALFINNADWLWNLNYIDFLRDIGPHFLSTVCLQPNATSSVWRRGLPSLNLTI